MDKTEPIGKLAALARVLQTGTIAGLIAIPIIGYQVGPRSSPRLIAAGFVLWIVATLSSLAVSHTLSPTRGFRGAIVALLLFLFLAVSLPIVL